MLKPNAAVNAKLDAFIAANPDTNTVYIELVKRHPEHAVRKLMLAKMDKFNEDLKFAQRLLPQLKAWVAEHPGMEESIQKSLENVAPARRDIVYVNIVSRKMVNVIGAPPRQSVGNGIGG